MHSRTVALVRMLATRGEQLHFINCWRKRTSRSCPYATISMTACNHSTANTLTPKVIRKTLPGPSKPYLFVCTLVVRGHVFDECEVELPRFMVVLARSAEDEVAIAVGAVPVRHIFARE